MSFVLDASITASWVFSDEKHPYADLAGTRLRTEEALAPAVFWFEIRNLLIIGERRNRITESGTARFLRGLSRLRVKIDRDPDEAEVLRLARTRRLTVYDASYLELAKRERVPLATLDTELASAAHAEGVALIGESSE